MASRRTKLTSDVSQLIGVEGMRTAIFVSYARKFIACGTANVRKKTVDEYPSLRKILSLKASGTMPFLSIDPHMKSRVSRHESKDLPVKNSVGSRKRFIALAVAIRDFFSLALRSAESIADRSRSNINALMGTQV